MKRPRVLLLNISDIGCRSTSKMAAESHSQGINQQIVLSFFRYSDWLSKQVAKKMREVLRKRTPREKYFKYQNFPTQFRFLLFQECFGEIWRESVDLNTL